MARQKLVSRLLFAVMVVFVAAIGAFSGMLLVYSTDLPQVSELERYRPSSITELYDIKGRVIGSFALQHRIVGAYEDYPKVLRDAIISIEDKGFERHWGVDLWRILGAAYHDIVSGSRVQGASTLTMQLSRNLFLSPDRTFSRKLQEVMLAIQIERRFTKQQIFTLYANQIFLGHGVYGFEAGAQFYFGKRAKELTTEEAALLAGLPKAPNFYSPINSPERALRRRNMVLNAMMEDGRITAQEAQRAKLAPIVFKVQNDPNFTAPYFVEEVRRYLEKKYGTAQVHERGLKVYTTLDLDLQQAANRAVLQGLASYERRRGWIGELPNVVASGGDLEHYDHPDWRAPMAAGSYSHGLVTQVSPNAAVVRLGNITGTIDSAAVKWTGYRTPGEILTLGDVVYVRILALDGNRAQLALEQDSGAQGALLAIDNQSGEIRAMVGGRDFEDSKFNRATQALRQTGSSFKPYVYTAAIDQGASPDDTVLDAPFTVLTASGPYTPHNYDNRFEGKITLRRALAQSRNIPALKMAQKVGMQTVIDYAHRFGITSQLQLYLPVALGAAEVTLLEHTAAYSAFPNDGVRVAPHTIRKVADYDGRVLEESLPEVRDVVGERTARIMTSMLREVVEHGTGAQAAKLKHALAGKTGTTNDFTDAWFMGFSPSITCGVWVGFDEKKTLGDKETGSLTALPIWIDFMRTAIGGHDDEKFAEPAAAAPPQRAIALTQGTAASKAVETR
jgi:penicillin-binding protein 1A